MFRRPVKGDRVWYIDNDDYVEDSHIKDVNDEGFLIRDKSFNKGNRISENRIGVDIFLNKEEAQNMLYQKRHLKKYGYCDVDVDVYAFGTSYNVSITLEKDKKYTYDDLQQMAKEEVLNHISISVEHDQARALGLYEEE